MTEQYEQLSEFLAGYFHQDWHLDDQSWEDVARRFVAESGENAGSLVAEQITLLTDQEESDAKLAEAVESFGCYYWPGSVAEMRTWLRDLSAELKSA
jgi:hypothetical protein